jgi:hypothetical protein
MVSLIAIVVWKLHWLLVLAVWIPFVTLDGLFLSSALTKIPGGAWFTLLLATVLSSIFVLWRYGKEKQWAAEETGVLKLSTFIRKNERGLYYLPDSMGGRELNPIKGKPQGYQWAELTVQALPYSSTREVTASRPSSRNLSASSRLCPRSRSCSTCAACPVRTPRTKSVLR